jgi:hypothetical protein
VRDDNPIDDVIVAGREQTCYARLLLYGGWTSLIALVLGFIVYAVGVLPPLIEVEELSAVWSLSSQHLREQRGHPSGWNWLYLLRYGDIFNLMGIALLASCSAVPLLAVSRLYWLRRDRMYALLSGAQVMVLLLAASGLVAVGH